MIHTSIEDEPIEDKCECEFTSSIPFLDTSLSIIDGHIDIDLYKKKRTGTSTCCHQVVTLKQQQRQYRSL